MVGGTIYYSDGNFLKPVGAVGNLLSLESAVSPLMLFTVQKVFRVPLVSVSEPVQSKELTNLAE